MTTEAFTRGKSDQFLKDTDGYLESVRRLIAPRWRELPFEVAAYTAMCRK